MTHGTFRNKISKLIGADKVELVCNSGLGFYSLKGIQIQKKLMTPNHMGVYHLSLLSRCHQFYSSFNMQHNPKASSK